MDPPAITSAPDPTDPSTVTSPSGWKIAWPERLALYTQSDVSARCGAGGGGAGSDRALTASTGAGRPPLTSGGRLGLSFSGPTPSKPMILTPRVPSSEIRWEMAELVSVTAERLSPPRRPTKKPLDPRNH